MKKTTATATTATATTALFSEDTAPMLVKTAAFTLPQVRDDCGTIGTGKQAAAADIEKARRAAENIGKYSKERKTEKRAFSAESVEVTAADIAAAVDYFNRFYVHEMPLATTKREIERAAKNAADIAAQREKLAAHLTDKNTLHALCISIIAAENSGDRDRAARLVYSLSTALLHAKINALQAHENTWNRVNESTKRAALRAVDMNGENKFATIGARLSECITHETKVNKYGDDVTTEKRDSKKEKALLDFLKNESNNDAMNIIHTAVVTAYEYIEKARTECGENMPLALLFTPFEKVVATSTTYMNGNEKPRALWKYRATNVVREMSLAIGREIAALRAVRDSNIAMLSVDSMVEMENGESVISRHYFRAADIAVDTTADIERTATANTAVNDKIVECLRALNLSKMQLFIFKNYMINNRFSVLEIADKLKTSESAVNVQIARIREKAIASGFFGELANNVQPPKSNREKANKVNVYKVVNGEKTLHATFDSVGAAAAVLNVSKGNISKVLNGKRKSASGYIFEIA